MKSPADFHTYQPLGIAHLTRLPRAALHAGLGTGKTVMALTALDNLSLTDDVYPALVLSTLRNARDTWPDEPKKWRHLRHLRVASCTGQEKTRREALASGAPIIAANYEQAEWLVRACGDAWPFKTVIADESIKLKSFRTRQGGARAAALGRIAHRTPRWWNLTGKPAPNGLTDLWGQAWFVDGGQRLGRSFAAFQQRWFSVGRDGFSLTPLPFAREQIQDALRDVCLTIEGGDYFDLREPVRVRLEVTLPRQALAQYRTLERSYVLDLGDNVIEAANAAVKSMKCLQLASGAIFTDEHAEQWQQVHDAKIDRLLELVEERNGEPLLVAYHWRHDLHRLRGALGERCADLAHAKNLQAFKAGRVPVGLAHPASLGHGVDGMQNVCNAICFFSHWWDLDQREQIIERVGPMRQLQAGHDREMYVYDIVARDTLDAAVLARHDSKGTVQQALLDFFKRA